MAVKPAPRIPESAYELGELLEDFPVSRTELAFNLAGLSVLLGVLGAILYYRVPNLLAPQGVMDVVSLICGLAISLGGAGWSIWIIGQAYHNRHLRVLVFEKGFVCFRRKTVFTCRWQDVAWTKEEIDHTPLAAYPALRLHMHGGQEWTLSKATELVKNSDRLIETIEDKIAEVSLDGCLERLRDGKTLHFGFLSLNADGLTCGERTLRWSEIASITEERGNRVTIEQQGAWTTWAAVSVSAIDNKRLFLKLAEHLRVSPVREMARA
jgi:hypothetical protein